MVCKRCNTRVGDGDRYCPNCGNEARGSVRSESQGDSQNTRSVLAKDDEVDLELEAEVTPRASGESSGPAAAGDSTSLSPDPPRLRNLIAEQPELIEEGLTVHTSKNGKPIGAGYSTAVGAIDLLARDRRAGFVVVMVAEREPGAELVPEILERIGWVRKHLATVKNDVRAVVLLEKPPRNLSYAAAAVASTIRFKTYRMALTLEDVEL